MKASPVCINKKFTQYLNQLIGNLLEKYFPIKFPKMNAGVKNEKKTMHELKTDCEMPVSQ
jgi:hypothetical protein